MRGMIEKAIEKVLLGDDEKQCDVQTADFGSKHKIVICQRGFVYAGDVAKCGDYLVITNAVNVRQWGTKRGLGELAEKGTMPETKADACGTVRVHELAVVAMIDCKGTIHASA